MDNIYQGDSLFSSLADEVQFGYQIYPFDDGLIQEDAFLHLMKH